MGYDYIIRIACDDESVCNENIKKQYKELIETEVPKLNDTIDNFNTTVDKKYNIFVDDSCKLVQKISAKLYTALVFLLDLEQTQARTQKKK